ncbi:MAG: hypothetical protein ABEJ28_10015 [Salinigranum sp.]
MHTFERFRELFASEPAPRPYRCRTCRSTFEVQYHVCPDCGGFSIDPIDG